MKKLIFILFFIAAALVSCKSLQTTDGKKDIFPVKADTLSLIERFSKIDGESNFTTLRINGRISLQNGEDTNQADVDIKIQKDQQIIISFSKYLVKGFRIAFTKNSVSYYNRMDKTYFKGDYSMMEKKLGIGINFDHLQRLLLGKAVFAANIKAITTTIDGGNLTLRYDNGNRTASEILMDTAGVIIRQKIIADQGSFIDFNYGTTKVDKGLSLPSKINILARHSQTIQLEVNYDGWSVNSSFSLAYSIPEGYRQITE